MEVKPNKAAALWDQLARVFNQFAAMERSPRDFGTGDKLFPSEIHVVEAIGLHPGINMTDLASVLGISKPAVVQIIAKVAKKKLVERYNGAHNRKEVLARLTERGETAFCGHQEFHSRMDAVLKGRFEQFTSTEFDIVSELFKDLALYFDEALEERNSEGSFQKSPSKK